MLGNSDLIMRQEQYQDLLREAQQERLLRTSGLVRPRRWNLLHYFNNFFNRKKDQEPAPAPLKRVAL